MSGWARPTARANVSRVARGRADRTQSSAMTQSDDMTQSSGMTPVERYDVLDLVFAEQNDVVVDRVVYRGSALPLLTHIRKSDELFTPFRTSCLGPCSLPVWVG